MEIWNEGNLDLVEEFIGPECVMHHPARPEGIVGHEAFKSWVTYNRTVFPDFNVTIEVMIVKGDKVAACWVVTGTNTGPIQTSMGELPPTGKQVRFTGVDISRIVNGKFVEGWSFLNMLDLYQQLGFTLTPPERLELSLLPP